VSDIIDLTQASIGLVLVALAGALAGAAGYAALVRRRETDRIVRLTDRLAEDPTLLASPETLGVRDRRLRASFVRLGDRMARTWTLATVDKLTQVANRQAVLARLIEELERAARYARPLSIVLVDIDHFKRLNDTHGHLAGDRVLTAIARALRENVRSVDTVGRYGGEEFMIVLPETDVDAAASLAEKLRRRVGGEVVELEDGSRVSVTLSAGVTGGLGTHLRMDVLVRDADAALYSAKALGRDQVYVFREVEDDGPVRRAAIAPAARESALEVGRIAFGAATASLADVLAERPGWAGRPSELIAATSTMLARSLGLPDREIERIRVASLLHDLGKLAIPDEILAKPSELEEPEWRVVAEHPKIGQVVLEQAGALRDAATIVLHHHEWFDGRGYPHGLAGEEIPVGARIVSVVDAYEAMTSGRPYRAAISHADAVAELRRHAGVQFDPDIVDRFVDLFEAGLPPDLEALLDEAHGSTVAPVAAPPVAATGISAHALAHDGLHARRRRASARADEPSGTPSGTGTHG
jgi:diguanylate cyclase (GGDEF)-like protein